MRDWEELSQLMAGPGLVRKVREAARRAGPQGCPEELLRPRTWSWSTCAGRSHHPVIVVMLPGRQPEILFVFINTPSQQSLKRSSSLSDRQGSRMQGCLSRKSHFCTAAVKPQLPSVRGGRSVISRRRGEVKIKARGNSLLTGVWWLRLQTASGACHAKPLWWCSHELGNR